MVEIAHVGGDFFDAPLERREAATRKRNVEVLMTALVLISMLAQTPASPDPTTQTGSARRTYEAIKGYITKSAEKSAALRMRGIRGIG